jgi:hypothetical protein
MSRFSSVSPGKFLGITLDRTLSKNVKLRTYNENTKTGRKREGVRRRNMCRRREWDEPREVLQEYNT